MHLNIMQSQFGSSTQRKLHGLRVVHAATSPNMLVAFGRVMAQRIVEEGADLYLIASSEYIYGRSAQSDELKAMGGTPFSISLKNSVSPINLLRGTYQFWKLLRKIKPNIVHTRGAVMGIVGRLAARMAGIPCVVHHQDDLYAREEQLSPWKRKFAASVERFLANSSDQIFVVSNAIETAAIEIGFDPKLITNVGHDLSSTIRQFAAISRPLRAEFSLLKERGITDDHFLVGSVTRLESHKGVDILVDIATKVLDRQPNVRFLVRGRGPEKFAIQELISKNGLADRFFLVDDWLSDETLVQLYKSFDLFALPTRREGFGMAFAEAMYLGVVPVAPDISPVNEVVRPETGLLVSLDAVAFANAICWTIAHPRETTAIRDRAIEVATNRWEGTKAADRVISTYCKLLRSQG